MAYPLLLHSKHSSQEIHYENVGEWIVPWTFTSLSEEYAALKTSAGVIDYSTQALIEIGGKDRVGFLHNLLTQHIKQLSPGTGAAAALLTANGKLIAEFLVLCDVDKLWLMCGAEQAASITETLNRYLFSEQVAIINHEREEAVFAIEGPNSFSALQQLAGTPVTLPQPNNHLRLFLDGVPLWVIRHSLIAGTGALCVIASEHAQALWLQLKACGVKPVGWEAFNAARIESGIPWFGIDMNEENLLPETRRQADTVSDNKGCYLGQEVIARLETYGSLSKKLMGLRIEGGTVPEPGAAISAKTIDAGKVTSACWSPGLKQAIALGYLKRDFYEAGTQVDILGKDSVLRAAVVELPFL